MVYEMYQFFAGATIESIIFFSGLAGYFALLIFGIERGLEIEENQTTEPNTPDIEEKTLVEHHKPANLLRTSMSSMSSVMFESPKTQERLHDWNSFNRRSAGADSGYVTMAGSRELQSNYGNVTVIEPTSIKSVFRDSEGRYLSNNQPFPVAAGDFTKPHEIDTSLEEVSDDSDEYEDECSSIWLFDNASIAEDQVTEQAMLQDKEIMAEWRDLLTRSWKTDIGTSSNQKRVAFVPSSENSLIEDTEAASILTVSSRFNEEVQDDIVSPHTNDDDEVIADDIDPDQLYRMWDRIQQQIQQDEKLALQLQQEEEAAEAKRQYESNTLNPFLTDHKSASNSTETTPRPPQHKN